MNLLRHAYLQIVPELGPYFVTGHQLDDDHGPLGHGSPQRPANLANSLTTTSSVVVALNSVLAGSLASDSSALLNGGVTLDVMIGAIVSLVSAALHVGYAARFRRRHTPP